MKLENGKLIFDSGREFPDPDFLCIHEHENAALGYDVEYYPFFDHVNYLTAAERAELADFAIACWQKFKE